MAADGPVPDALAFWYALCCGTDRHLLGLLRFWQRYTVCPKSWELSRKLRSSNCSAESQKKEKVSPPRLLLAEFYLPVQLLFSVQECVRQINMIHSYQYRFNGVE